MIVVRRAVGRAQLALLLAGVAVAFADSSIVVLALPELLRRSDASITGVSLVVTVYNAVLAVVAFALLRGARRWAPQRLARIGLGIFGAASLACAAAPSLTALIAARAIQGAGGAALLAGAFAVVRSLAPKRGLVLLGTAGAVGAAIGPSAGGLLTQAFDWRAIFAVQVPLAAAAFLGVRAAEWPPTARASVRANAALALVSGALVGALFLVVVLLIDVWGIQPAAASAVVAALPLGTLAGRSLGQRGLAPATGSVLLAGGLAALALIPASNVGWIVAALAFCGIGLGAVVPTSASEGGEASTAWRHAGLVLGLVLVTPLLTHDLAATPAKTERAVTASMLDAKLPIAAKVELARELARQFGNARELPHFQQAVAQAHTGADPRTLDTLAGSLDEAVRSTVTRGFRRTFLLCGALALLATLPLLRRRPGPAMRPRLAVAIVGAAVILVGTELAAGGTSYGSAAQQDPCRPRTLDVGGGLDGFVQRTANRALDAAACGLGTSREQLVLDSARTGSRWASAVRRFW